MKATACNKCGRLLNNVRWLHTDRVMCVRCWGESRYRRQSESVALLLSGVVLTPDQWQVSSNPEPA